MRAERLLAFLPLVSTVLFPWWVTSVLAVLVAPWEPLLPLAIGIILDVLYWAPGAHLPIFSLYGLVLTVFAFFVRERLRTSIIR